MTKQRISLLHIPIDPLTMDEVLEKIKIYLSSPPEYTHIISVNPENIIIAQRNLAFHEIYHKADLALTDGIGVVLGAKLLGFSIPERVSGSILLPRLLDLAGQLSLRVVLIGSQADLADKIAQRYSRSYPKATFVGLQGYENKEKPSPKEEGHIEDIVRSTRPHFVFVAFGSPYQEIWIDTHRSLLHTSICMGVGGSFDYLSGASHKPLQIIRSLGLEWVYRLIKEPWRARRQFFRLPFFVALILKQKIWCIMHPQNEKASPHGS